MEQGKHIGRLLALVRKIKCLSAAEVARRCNVTRGRIYQWEHETFILPKNLPALSAALDIPIGMLIAENGRRPQKNPGLSKIEHPCEFHPLFTLPSNYS